MTGYFGRTITYDTIGNPLTDGTWTYTWQNGRELASMTSGNTTWSYTYDANGLRKTRSNGTDTYTYVYNGSQLVQMTRGTDVLYFDHATGTVTWTDTTTDTSTVYYYVHNLQGDVVAILNSAGTAVVNYTYDAWGNLLATTGSMASTLGTLNPLTYRGYVYDRETGLYYVSSRYYDPEIGRFLNSDDPAIVDCASDFSIAGLNKYTYCLNDPISYADTYGTTATVVVKMILNFIWGMLGGLLGMYAGDVCTNIIKGAKNIFKRIQSIGTYVAEGVRAGCIAIFGNKIVQRIIVAVGTAVIKSVTDVIFCGKSFSWVTLIKDIITGVVVAIIVCGAPKIAKQLNKNNGQVKNKLISHVVDFLKNKFQKIINFFKHTFVKRFSISYAKTMFSNIKSLIFG